MTAADGGGGCCGRWQVAVRGSRAGRGSAESCGRVGAKPSPKRAAPCAGSMGPCRVGRPEVSRGAAARPAGTWRPVSAAAAGRHPACRACLPRACFRELGDSASFKPCSRVWISCDVQVFPKAQEDRS